MDLYKERLEIAVCAQHNNGGLSADSWWETGISGLYAVGEVCASHGVTRPGGTALNAGQVGAVRAAEGIRLKKVAQTENTENDFRDADVKETLRKEAFKRKCKRRYSIISSLVKGV